ncbi:MAG TPA: hypothetical protein VG650_05040 [Mycobacteriales bacterium]|nr:hypothetical protein [Mycobacteriales bacterium]HWC34175.1 hypothetical protein [Mycobacteriales bacterium]
MWYFRVLECEDGTWACGRGRELLDSHDTLTAAIDHCRSLAAAARPSQVLVHHLTGRPTIAAEFAA